jgi:hypothetical protein
LERENPSPFRKAPFEGFRGYMSLMNTRLNTTGQYHTEHTLIPQDNTIRNQSQREIKQQQIPMFGNSNNNFLKIENLAIWTLFNF